MPRMLFAYLEKLGAMLGILVKVEVSKNWPMDLACGDPASGPWCCPCVLELTHMLHMMCTRPTACAGPRTCAMHCALLSWCGNHSTCDACLSPSEMYVVCSVGPGAGATCTARPGQAPCRCCVWCSGWSIGPICPMGWPHATHPVSGAK